jgi:hypothetical protein
MNIEIGKFYLNKTWKYLLPCIKEYGPLFSSKIATVFKLAVGVGDAFLDSEDITSKRAIYLLLDKKVQPAKFILFMDWIQNQPYYMFDYSFDDVLKGRRHILVIEVPEMYHNSYDYFMEGRYSEMYSSKEIRKLFGKYDNDNKYSTIWVEARETMLRSPELRKPFIEKLKENFGNSLDIKEIDLHDAELDLPIVKGEEIFNYNKI